jgi:hypothetical protein
MRERALFMEAAPDWAAQAETYRMLWTNHYSLPHEH